MPDNGEHQPARKSDRILHHEVRTGRAVSVESVAFAHRRDKRRAAAKAARAARKKNRR